MGGFTVVEIESTLSHVITKELAKGATIFKEGTRVESICFISKGYLRTYQLVDGKEKSISFAQPGQFVRSLNGLLHQSPSDE